MAARMKGLLVWLVLTQAADIATTAVALRRGCHEVNPAASIGLKSGVTLALVWGAPKMAHGKALVIGFASVGTATTAWNIATLARGC